MYIASSHTVVIFVCIPFRTPSRSQRKPVHIRQSGTRKSLRWERDSVRKGLQTTVCDYVSYESICKCVDSLSVCLCSFFGRAVLDPWWIIYMYTLPVLRSKKGSWLPCGIRSTKSAPFFWCDSRLRASNC